MVMTNIMPVSIVHRFREMRLVTGNFDSGHQFINGHTRRRLYRRLLGCEVDGRFNAAEAVQPLLDPRSAGGTAHTLEVELELRLAIRGNPDYHSVLRIPA